MNGDFILRPDGSLTLNHRRHSVEAWHIDSNSVTSRIIRDKQVKSKDLADNISIRNDLGVKNDVSINGDLSVDGTITGSLSGDIVLPSLTTSRPLSTNASGTITTASISQWLSGTPDQITVTDNNNGSATLSLPQSIDTSDSPTFSGITLSGLASGYIPFIGPIGQLSTASSPLFWNTSNNRLGIGTASPQTPLDFQATLTDTTGSTYGGTTPKVVGSNISTSMQQSATLPTSANFYGQRVVSQIPSSSTQSFGNNNTLVGSDTWAWQAGSGNVTEILGSQAVAYQTGSGTVLNMWGMEAAPYVAAGTISNISSFFSRRIVTGGTVTNAIGLRLYPVEISGAGTVTNNYGIFMDSATLGNGTNNWGIYQANNYQNYFNGKIGIGTTTPSSSMHIWGVNGTVGLEINSNATTGTNNILMARSDAASADDPVFRVQANGAVYADGAYTSTGADYAEYFFTDDSSIEPGDAVCLDLNLDNAIRRCENDGDNTVLGIVSTRPSMIGNSSDGREHDPHYKVVGMLGQIPGKVAGNISIGDPLTPSSRSGILRKARLGEATIGVALQNSEQGDNMVQVLISRHNGGAAIEKIEQSIIESAARTHMENQTNELVRQATQEILKNSESIQLRVATLETLVSNTYRKSEADSRVQETINDLGAIQKSKDADEKLDLDALLFKDSKSDMNLGNGSVIAEYVKVSDVEAKKSVTTATIRIAAADSDHQTIGSAVIRSGEQKVIIKTDALKELSKVFVSTEVPIPIGVTKSARNGYFTVTLSEKTDQDIPFSWWIIEADAD